MIPLHHAPSSAASSDPTRTSPRPPPSENDGLLLHLGTEVNSREVEFGRQIGNLASCRSRTGPMVVCELRLLTDSADDGRDHLKDRGLDARPANKSRPSTRHRRHPRPIDDRSAVRSGIAGNDAPAMLSGCAGAWVIPEYTANGTVDFHLVESFCQIGVKAKAITLVNQRAYGQGRVSAQFAVAIYSGHARRPVHHR